MKRVWDNVDAHFKKHPTNERRIVIGLSGGPDSVYLLTALHHYAQAHNNLMLVAAHLNHGWRETALRDQEFCQTLCNNYNIPLIIEHATNIPLANTPSGSKEAHGRALRRTFLTTVADNNQTPLIALGHHQDDQIETFFMRLARGSTIDGLRCMRLLHGRYWRPLLTTTKQEIIASLADLNIPFIHDESNDSPDFLRNRIRHHLIPTLNQTDHRFSSSILHTIDHLRDVYEVMEQVVVHQFSQIFSVKEGTIIGNKILLIAQPALIQRMLLLRLLYTAKVPFVPQQSFLEEICRFLHHESGGSHRLGTHWTIIKKKQSFWIKQEPEYTKF